MRRVSWRMRNGVSSRWRGRAGGGDEQLRLVALGLQRAQRRQPLGHDPQGRGGAVVGQAVPGREGQHLALLARTTGRYPRARASPLRRRRSRPRGRLARSVRRAREVGGEPRQEARRHARKGQRLVRACRTRCSGSLISQSGCNRASSAPRSSGRRSARAARRFRCAHAMMSTSCSLEHRRRTARTPPHPKTAWCASKNPPISMSASRVPR